MRKDALHCDEGGDCAPYEDIKTALRWGSDFLACKGSENPRWEAEVLLAHHLGLSRARLYAQLNRTLPHTALASYRKLVERRACGEPLAYIMGHEEFYGLDFYVDERVFIPRPETELLVEKAFEIAREMEDDLIVADVGTGCGAIAVALAVHLPKAKVYAIDASPEALEVAAINCRRHGVEGQVHLLEGDLLTPLPEPVDIIAANLPYVAREEFAKLSKEILDHEPLSALDGGPDGLAHIRRLLAEAGEHLNLHGAILLEIGATQGPAVVRLAGWHFPKAKIELIKDYAGLDRVVIVRA